MHAAIQPHGYLISCTLPDWTVRQASANVQALLDQATEDVIGRNLREYIADDVLQPLREAIEVLDPDAPPQRAAAGNIGAHAHLCDIGVHVADGLVHLEFEPRAGAAEDLAPTVVVQRMIARIGASIDMRDFHQRTAKEIRELTGFDRVVVVRFGGDDLAEVIAEVRADGMATIATLRAPASDRSAQAPQGFLRNRIHVIPDARCVPVPLVPGRDAAGIPLDLRRHALRCASPGHLASLLDMGVAASMSISIVSGGRPWGAIACHHRVPRLVPPSVRTAADMFGLFASMRITAAEQASRLDQLGTLLDGLGQLGETEGTRIGERIAALEAQLRQLALGSSLA